IMPVVAPIIDPPGGPYVEGMRPLEIAKANEQFLSDLGSGKISGAPATAREALVYREKVRADERVTVAEARAAGWNDEEMKQASTLAWEVCRTTDFLPALQKRKLEF